MIWTEVHHLFGVTSEFYRERNPQLLAEDTGRTPFIQPVKLDDVIALAYRGEGGGLLIKVGIIVKKGKEELPGVKKTSLHDTY